MRRKVIDDGLWHHVAGVYDGRMATFYIDGRRDVSAAVAGSIAANNLSLWVGWDSHRTEWAWESDPVANEAPQEKDCIEEP